MSSEITREAVDLAIREVSIGEAKRIVNQAIEQMEAVLEGGHMGQADLRKGFGDRLLALLGTSEKFFFKEELVGVDWEKYIKENPSPKYEGIKTSGKARDFFLEWYRGKTIDMEKHTNNRIDCVQLGMTQAHLCHIDEKLLKFLINAKQYNPDFGLDAIIPSLYKRTTSK